MNESVKHKKSPQRMCVGCREMRDKKTLIRIVRTPADEIIADPSGKQPGRGAYLCKEAECLKKALKNKGLERSLKMKADKDTIEKVLGVFGDVFSQGAG